MTAQLPRLGGPSRGFILGCGPTWTDLLRQKDLEKQIEELEKELENCNDCAEAEQLQARIDELKNGLVDAEFI